MCAPRFPRRDNATQLYTRGGTPRAGLFGRTSDPHAATATPPALRPDRHPAVLDAQGRRDGACSRAGHAARRGSRFGTAVSSRMLRDEPADRQPCGNALHRPQRRPGRAATLCPPSLSPGGRRREGLGKTNMRTHARTGASATSRSSATSTAAPSCATRPPTAESPRVARTSDRSALEASVGGERASLNEGGPRWNRGPPPDTRGCSAGS